MKGFAYTARDAAGKTKSGVISADDRTAAIREIRALNLVPITLEERAGPILGPANRKPLPMRTLVLAVGVLVVAAVALLMFLKRPATTRPPTAPSAAPAAPASPSALATPSTPAVPAAPVVTAPPNRPHHPGYIKTVTPDTQHPTLDTRPPPSVAETLAPPPIVEPPPPPKPEPERIYKTATEQLLSMLGRPGESVPPLPLSGKEDFAADFKKALTNLIVIYETDDAHMVNRKETVAWLKVQLDEMQKEGWTPAEVIKALEAQRREEAAERNAAMALLREIALENPDQVDEARERINEDLLAKGLLPLPIPRKRRQ